MKKLKVIAAMSGGVDSAVAAARAVDAGWPYPCHFFNTPVPPASTLPSLFRRSL